MSLSISYVADVNFPPGFKLYGGVLPERKYLKDGTWLIVATGSYPVIPNSFGVYAFQWEGGTTVAKLVAYPVQAFNRISNSRGGITTGENSVFIWAIDYDSVAQVDRFKIFLVNGAIPVADDENRVSE